MPDALHGSDEPDHAGEVAIDAEVVDVPAYAPAERGMLLLDRLVSVAPTEVVDGLLGPLEPCLPGSEVLPPVSFPASLPQQCEAQKVAGPRTFAPIRPPWRSGEGHEPGLLRVQLQAVLRHPLLQHRHHLLGVFASLESDDQVVRIAHQAGFAP